MEWIDELSFDERGLLPVVVQEVDTGEVLMLAYANREALHRTVDTGEAHYWSRSRAALWRKGETSGNVQQVHELRPDCDADAVLYRVRQTGPACHTRERSCFHREVSDDALQPAGEMGDVLDRLERTIARRAEERPEGSYTNYLFEQGLDKILKKVGEEATEVVIAAKNAASDSSSGSPAELRAEVADLFFHLLVLLRERGVPLREIRAELDARFGAPPPERPMSGMQSSALVGSP